MKRHLYKKVIFTVIPWKHGVIKIFGWFSESWENLQAQLMSSDFCYLAPFWSKNGPKVKQHFFQKTRKTVNFGTFYRFCDIWKKISWVRNVRYRPNISFIPFLLSNISFFEVLNPQSKSVNPQFPIKLELLKIGIFSKVYLI